MFNWRGNDGQQEPEKQVPDSEEIAAVPDSEPQQEQQEVAESFTEQIQEYADGDKPTAGEVQQFLDEHPEIREDLNVVWAADKVQGFVLNMNPNFIRSRIERAKTEAMQEANSTNWGQIVMLIGTLAFIIAIVWKIFQSGGGQAAAQTASSAAGGTTSISVILAGVRKRAPV